VWPPEVEVPPAIGGGRVIRSSPMAIERTYAMVKPDGVRRGLVGEVVGRLEAKGFRIVGMKLMQITRETAERHYGEHTGKPFFEGLISFITSGPVVAMVVEGEDAIAAWRTMMGATNPKDAAPGTIRGDLAATLDENVAHGSDAPATAEREIGIFFKEHELLA
jgi:nucleoside-diphosphate kinase